MQKPKDSAARSLAKELDRFYPEWIPHPQAVEIVRRHLGEGIHVNHLINASAKRGVYLERKRDSHGRAFFRLSGVGEPLTNVLSMARRRIKTDPASALISLSYSDLAKHFNK